MDIATTEMNPMRSADFDPTPGGEFLKTIKEGLTRLHTVEQAFVAMQGVHTNIAGNLKRRAKPEDFFVDVEEAKAALIQSISDQWLEADSIKGWLGKSMTLARPDRYRTTKWPPGHSLWLVGTSRYSAQGYGNCLMNLDISRGIALSGELANVSLKDNGTLHLVDGYISYEDRPLGPGRWDSKAGSWLQDGSFRTAVVRQLFDHNLADKPGGPRVFQAGVEVL